MSSRLTQAVTNGLKSKLIDLIRMKGPLTVADYMRIVLTNPESGFYMKDDVFGVKGHFTTNPEISQMFGEVIGAWFLQEWRRFNRSQPFRLIEMGPGRGTLTRDVTRTISCLNEKPEKVDITFVELSPHLKEIQASSLKTLQSSGFINHLDWYTHINALPKFEDGFSAFIAHEYLDALPINKFVRDRQTGKMRDLLIDYDEYQNLRFSIANQPSLAARLLVPEDFVGDHIEVCAEAVSQVERVVTQLNRSQSGCMLICDYGFEDESQLAKQPERQKSNSVIKPPKANRDTFRAFKEHQAWNPLKDPGTADLTADVDFGFIKRHIEDKALIFGPVDQKTFLLKCGLQARFDKLLEKVPESDKNDLKSEFEILVHEMGSRYKFMAIFPKDTNHLFNNDPPAGFDNLSL